MSEPEAWRLVQYKPEAPRFLSKTMFVAFWMDVAPQFLIISTSYSIRPALAMYSLLTLECVALLVEAIVYGIYVITFTVTIVVLVRRRSSLADRILAAATVVMFILSTAHLVLLASSILRHIQAGIIGDGLEFRDPSYPEPFLQIVLECLNCILGDAIITWRAWVLWGRKKFVLAVPVILLVAAFGSTIGLCRAVILEPTGSVTFTAPGVQHWGAGALGLTFLANVWGVVFVSLRFRTYQKEVAVSLPSQASSGASPTAVLLFLAETGTLYCCSLLAVAITFITHTSGVYIVLDLVAQFTGVYPTLMVFLIVIRKTQKNSNHLTNGSMVVTQVAESDITRLGSIVFAPIATSTSVDCEHDARYEGVHGHGKFVLVA